MNQECSKRSLLYETWCLSCENRELEKIKLDWQEDAEFQKLGESEYKKRIRDIKKFKYVGETSKSAFERGFEHLNDLTSLSSKSHMLRHIVEVHQGQDLSKIQFGMRVIEYTRTSFERQIREAVRIEQESKKHHI